MQNFAGTVQIEDDNQVVTIKIDGNLAAIDIGGYLGDLTNKPIPRSISYAGQVNIFDDKGNPCIKIADGSVILAGMNGKQGCFLTYDTLNIGGNGSGATINLLPSKGFQLVGLIDPDQVAIRLRAEDASVQAGGNGINGQFAIFPPGATGSQIADMHYATVHLRASDGVIRAGGAAVNGKVLVLNEANTPMVTLDGKAGDLLLYNADCAEDFDVVNVERAEPGTVMVLDDEGRLHEATRDYDRKVAGVISGAGGYKPAIVLGSRPARAERASVALFGKVYCIADAMLSPIEVGDLLTTSTTPGHAMKATDPVRAFGAVLGKALKPLKTGQNLIPILVALQ
jgi:hypothetical protein